jgi:hypothetical protein
MPAESFCDSGIRGFSFACLVGIIDALKRLLHVTHH